MLNSSAWLDNIQNAAKEVIANGGNNEIIPPRNHPGVGEKYLPQNRPGVGSRLFRNSTMHSDRLMLWRLKP